MQSIQCKHQSTLKISIKIEIANKSTVFTDWIASNQSYQNGIIHVVERVRDRNGMKKYEQTYNRMCLYVGFQ